MQLRKPETIGGDAVSPVTPVGVTGGSALRTFGRGAAAVALGIAGFLIIGLVWQAIALVSDPARLPAPTDVISIVGDRWSSVPSLEYVTFQEGGIGSALGYTTVNVLVGVGIGAVLGVPVGILLARWLMFRLVVEPALLFVGTMPLLIMLPFITLWFGTARIAQSGLVIVFSFLTVAFAVQSAARGVGERYAEWAACLGASQARILREVILPAVTPDLVGALRLALAAGWGLQVIAELLGSEFGVGRLIQVTSQVTATQDLMATLVCLAAVALIVDSVVAALGKATVRWTE